jgi:TonB family protein
MIKGSAAVSMMISMLLNGLVLLFFAGFFFRSPGSSVKPNETVRPFMVFSAEPVFYETVPADTVSSIEAVPAATFVSPAAVSEKSAGIEESAGETITKDFLDLRIRELISRQLRYPLAARRRGIEGAVRLILTISAGGELQRIQLQESSGSSLLDNAALDLLRRIFPLGMQLPFSMDLAINIQYRLEDEQ